MMRVIVGAALLIAGLTASQLFAAEQPKPIEAHTEWTTNPDPSKAAAAGQVNLGEGKVHLPAGWTVVGDKYKVHVWATHTDDQTGSTFGEGEQAIYGTAAAPLWNAANINTGLPSATKVHVILVMTIMKKDGKTIKISTVPKETTVK